MRAAAGPGTSAKAANAPPLSSHLHVRVIGPSAAFGCDPVDVLGRVLDVARLAVDAILGVDLQPRFATLGFHEFIHARDRKSTRLNSSHLVISYAVFCLKKKMTSYRPETYSSVTGTSGILHGSCKTDISRSPRGGSWYF